MEVADWQAALAGDLEKLRDFGRQHAQVWAGVSFAGPRLQVRLTDPGAHREAIRALVEHPDQVDVLFAPRTEVELGAVRDAVEQVLQRYPGSWYAFGVRRQVVTVTLAGSALELAGELHERFGDVLEMTVGGHHYPLSDGRNSFEPVAGPVASGAVPGLELQVELATAAVPAGGKFRGKVWLRNGTADVMELDSDQPLAGALLDLNGFQVGGYAGWNAGTGWSCRLAPGERVSIDFFAGLDTSDVHLGTTLPPGDYDLVVPVPIGLGRPRLRLISPAVRVHVLPA